MGLVSCFAGIHAQTDSLLALLDKSSTDTNKVQLLSQLYSTFKDQNEENPSRYLREALELSVQLNYQRGLAKTYYQLASSHTGPGGNADSASYYNGKALSLAGELKWHSIIGYCWLVEARLNADQGNQTVALEHYQKALDEFKKGRDEKGEAQTHNNMGILFLRSGEGDKALGYFLKAIAYYETAGEDKRLSTTRINLAGIYAMQNKFPEAIEQYNLSLEYLKQTGQQSIVAMVYEGLGTAYSDLGDIGTAIGYFENAERILLEQGPEQRLLGLYTNFGSTLNSKPDFSRALKYLNRALKISRQYKAAYYEGAILGAIALSYYKMDSLVKAAPLFEQAIAIQEQTNDQWGMVRSYQNYGALLFKRGEGREAQRLLVKATGLARSVKDWQSLSEAYLLLSRIEERRGDIRTALEYRRKYEQFNDSVANKDFRAKLALNRIKFESRIKEQENQRLKQQSRLQQQQLHLAEIKRRNDQTRFWATLAGGGLLLVVVIAILIIVRQRNERKVVQLKHTALRSQMNPHFIFNSLNSLQRLYMEGRTEEAETYIADFSRLLRSILENSGENTITVKEELLTLKAYLDLERLRTSGMMEYDLVVDENIDQNRWKIPPLVIQPFVENAIWHGILPNKKKGTVRIELTLVDHNKLKCTIKDDGVGIDLEQLSTSAGSGIRLTGQRLGDSVRITRLDEGGTQVELVIPITR